MRLSFDDTLTLYTLKGFAHQHVKVEFYILRVTSLIISNQFS